MPLFFFISGFASQKALESRGAGAYALERLKKLGIPFIALTLLTIPLAQHYAHQNHGDYEGGMGESILIFFSNPPDAPSTAYGPFMATQAYEGRFGIGHLWFILVLLLFSLIALPLFSRLKNLHPNPSSFLFLPVLVLSVAQLCPHLINRNLVYFFCFFVMGYVTAANPAIEDLFCEKRKTALVLGPGLLLTFVFALFLGLPMEGWVLWFTRFFVFTFITWFCLVALLAYARLYLNRNSSLLRALCPAAYPFYLLHFLPVVWVSFHVIQTPWSIPVKFVAILLGSTGLTTLVYLVARPIRLLGPVLGIKHKRKPKPFQAT